MGQNGAAGQRARHHGEDGEEGQVQLYAELGDLARFIDTTMRTLSRFSAPVSSTTEQLPQALTHLTDLRLLTEQGTHEVISAGGVLRRSAERRMAAQKIDELQIKAVDCSVPVATLSGGNQQKVLIARWLQRPYRVIILDEPTRGVDVGARVEIYSLINRMALAGTAVVMITSELPEAIGMADRIGVMAKGRLIATLDNPRRDVTQETILRLAVGEAGARP